MPQPFKTIRRSFTLISIAILMIGCAQENNSQANTQASTPPGQIPEGMFVVTPVHASNSTPPTAAKEPPAKNLQIMKGRYFTYVLPEGWKTGEDGQFALTMTAHDGKALTLMVGNAGLFPNTVPGQYVYEKLMAIRPENLQIGQGQPCEPIAGFQSAYIFPVTYAIGGVPCQGQAKCHLAPYYGGVTMAMTAALSEGSQWKGYSTWLPMVAEQIAAHDGAAFGMRGVMQQNIDNSRAYAEAAKNYRAWSQQNWQAVTDDRNATQDRQQKEFRENIGAVQTYNNPYDGRQPIELTTQYQYYWIDNKGTTILGSNDPSVNPNHGSTSEWKKMEKQ